MRQAREQQPPATLDPAGDGRHSRTLARKPGGLGRAGAGGGGAGGDG